MEAKPGLKWHRRSVLWMASALVVLAMKSMLPSSIWDRWYYQGIFIGFRQLYDWVLGWSPLPMVYIVLLIIIVRFANWLGQFKKGFVYQFTRALGGIAAMVTIFYLAWGFNYGQVPLQTRLGTDFSKADQAGMEAEFNRATNVLMAEAGRLPGQLTTDESIRNLSIRDHDLRPDVEQALLTLGLPHQGKVRVRQLWPKGFLLRWNTAGIYIPQAGEGHIDKGLLSVQKPFTIAHEMAHGYGVADEGACNFVAWLACSRSRDQWVRFGGALTYWRYTASAMPWESVKAVIQQFPPVLQRTVDLINENDRKYPDLLPKVRDAIYSSYLKGNGIHHGLKSYNEVVVMVQQYLDRDSTQTGIH